MCLQPMEVALSIMNRFPLLIAQRLWEIPLVAIVM